MTQEHRCEECGALHVWGKDAYAASEKVRREVAEEMAHWYPPERSMEDPATVRRIAEWRAKLLEGLGAEWASST